MKDKTTEEALGDCRRRLAYLLHTVPGMAYRCRFDPDWTMEFLSEGCEALTGYPPDDLLHNARIAYGALIHPEDRRMVYGKVREAVEGNGAFQVVYRITTARKEQKWVSEKGLILREDKGPAIEGFISDITEYKRTEALLRDEVARRRILVEQSRDGIVVLDQNGRVYEANPQYAKMLGYSLEEILGLYVWDWDKTFSKAELLEQIQSIDAGGDHFETLHQRKDGTFYAVEISTNGMVYQGRKLIFCICRDITQRKQAEKEREKLIAELKAALVENKTLKGILPICSYCKKIRTAEGRWEPVDVYIHRHSQADISHGICPECAKQHYPDIDLNE